MTETKERVEKENNGRAFGWISGLGAVIFPWIIAGIVSSFAGVISEDWNPENTFPKFLLGAVGAWVIWLVYGAVRIPGFKRGAIRGASIAFGIAAVLYGLVFFLQPD